VTPYTILIPGYNEAANVDRLRTELWPVACAMAASAPVEILLVDDGSTDGTHQAFEAFREEAQHDRLTIRVVRHASNRGLGAALHTGFSHASGRIVITTDCDATYAFDEIPMMIAHLGTADIVTASPYHPRGSVENVPGYRLALSRSASSLYRAVVDPRVHTYTALFRAYRREVLERVPFNSDGFLAGTELLVNAMLMGYRVVEYPTVLRARRFGSSKAKLARTTQAHFGFMARTAICRLTGRRGPVRRPSRALPVAVVPPSPRRADR
jgi:dolichol-phosphate mannosyltransferase